MTISIPTKNENLTKITYVFLILISAVVYYIAIDFSKFFPSSFKLICGYDQYNINKLIQRISIKEIDGMQIISEGDEYSNTLEEYIEKIDKCVKDYTGFEDFFFNSMQLNENVLESTGKTIFILTKMQKMHQYLLKDAKGELFHTIRRPGLNTISIKQYFNKINSKHDCIRLNSIHSILKGKIVLTPMFEQLLAVDLFEVKLDHILYAATTVRIFPYPSYSDTIYLYKKNNKLYPIAYAVHISEKSV